MKIIKRVTQFPLQAQPEGDITYNINTKQLRVYKDNNGTFIDYDSFYVSPDVDALSVNGYYPLYRSESLANAASPLGTSHPHNGTDLGTAPAGVDYPLYMPNGLDTMYHGNYVDPLGDDDSDGIPNFRDPAIVGLTALPSAGIKSGSPFTTPLHSGGSGGGVTVPAGDITNLISEPGSGSYNDTDKTITLNATGPGLLIKSDGSLTKFNQGDSVSIEPGDTFIYQGGMTGSGQSSLGNTGGDSANYSGSGNFTTNGGAVVDVEDALKAQNDGTIDSGTQNNTGSSITKPFSGTGVLVDDAGSITPVTSPATIPPGSTLFVKSGGKNDALHWDGSTMPFTTPDGTVVDLTNHLTNDGSGTAYINNSGGTASISWTGDGLLFSPQGAVTQVTSPYDVPAGWMIFTGTYGSSSSGAGSSSGGGSSTTGTDAGYTGTGSYSTAAGSVDVEDALSDHISGTIDSGTSNGGSSSISKTFDSTKQTAILVDDTTGVVTAVTSSPVTIPPGSTLFIKSPQLNPLTISDASLDADSGGTFTVAGHLHSSGDKIIYDMSTDPQFNTIQAGGSFTGTIPATFLSYDTVYYIRAQQFTDGLIPSNISEWSNVISAQTGAASTYTISYSHDGNSSSGTTNPSPNSVNDGTVITLGDLGVQIWNPASSGYQFDKWEIVSGPGSLDNANSATGATFTVNGGDAEIRATFTAVAQPTTRLLTINTSAHGTETGAGSYSHNDSVSISATPTDSSQYEFQKWRVISGGGQSFFDTLSSTDSFIMPDNDVVIEAVYQAKQYTVTVSGTNGTQTGDGSYTPGDTVTLTATPNSGYEFVSWNVLTSASAPLLGLQTGNAFGMPSSNVEVEAVYQAVTATPNTATPNTRSYNGNVAGGRVTILEEGGQYSNTFLDDATPEQAVAASIQGVSFHAPEGYYPQKVVVTGSDISTPIEREFINVGPSHSIWAAGQAYNKYRVIFVPEQSWLTPIPSGNGETFHFEVTYASSQSATFDVTVDNLTWNSGTQLDVSAGQWSGGFTPYHMTSDSSGNPRSYVWQNGQAMTITMDSSAFTIGASSADTIENWLRVPDTGNLIKMTYSKTYTVNSNGNTGLIMTINGITYTYDFTTSGNTSNAYSSPFDMTKMGF